MATREHTRRSPSSGAIALGAALLAACPPFSGAPLGCRAPSDCVGEEVCTEAGRCCPPVECGERCGVQTNACGASAECCVRFVDTRAETSGDGSAERPFASITEALEGAKPGSILRAAAGVYGPKERFPITLRGVSLYGAGMGETLIRGHSLQPRFAIGVSIHSTILIGDPALPSAIGDLSVVTEDRMVDKIAIHCDRGGGVYPTGDEPTITTSIERVEIDGPYTIGVLGAAAGDAGERACTLAVSDSTVRGTLKQGLRLQGDCEARAWVAATTSGARFSDMELDSILVYDCTRRASFDLVSIARAHRGLTIVQTGPDADMPDVPYSHFVVTQSRFEDIDTTGLRISRRARVARLEDSVFTRIRGSAVELNGAVNRRDGETFAAITRMRRNVVTANAAGVVFVGTGAMDSANDWGTELDPGENVLRCNSSTVGGGDVVIDGPRVEPGALSAVGNVWDHAPPTMSPDAREGLDLRAPSAAPIEVMPAATTTIACPSGWVRGP